MVQFQQIGVVMKWIIVVVGVLMMMTPPVLEDTKYYVSFRVGIPLIFCGVAMFLGGLWWAMA